MNRYQRRAERAIKRNPNKVAPIRIGPQFGPPVIGKVEREMASAAMDGFMAEALPYRRVQTSAKR